MLDREHKLNEPMMKQIFVRTLEVETLKVETLVVRTLEEQKPTMRSIRQTKRLVALILRSQFIGVSKMER